MTEQENNKAAVEKFFSTVGSPEHFTYSDTYFHKDHKWHFPFVPQPVDAKEHKKMDEAILRGFPDFKIILDDILAVEDKVIVRGKMTGTHKGDFNNIPPTGRKINLPFIGIMKFKDGKNFEEWVEADTSKLFKQIGVSAMEPA